MKILGIDPGLRGAMAMWHGGRITHIQDLPLAAGEINGQLLWSSLRLTHSVEPIDMAYIEETHAMPKTGSQGNYSQGFSKGTIITALRCAEIPVTRVAPSVWKNKMGLRGKDKEYARRLAMELWPDQEPKLKRKGDHNRAEACLIARYGSFAFHQAQVAS